MDHIRIILVTVESAGVEASNPLVKAAQFLLA
jgi:hypothetical protein